MSEKREASLIPREIHKLVLDFLLANKDPINEEYGIDINSFLGARGTSFSQKKTLFMELVERNEAIDLSWGEFLGADSATIRSIRKALGVPNKIPLSHFVSLAETTIADRDQAVRERYAELLESGLYQEVLRDKLRFRHQVPEKKIKNYIEHQSADTYRSVVELVSNAIDFSDEDGDVEVMVLETGFIIRDYGSGMRPHDIFERLTVPYMSGTRSNKVSIGRFGLGFFTVFNHLKTEGDYVELKTSGNGYGFKITYSYEGGQIYVATESSSEISKGTEIILSCQDFDEVAAVDTLNKFLRFKQGVDINLFWRGESQKVNKADCFEKKSVKHNDLEKTVSLVDHQPTTASSGMIYFLVNGVLIERHAITGLNVPKEFVVDFPYTTDLPESRNEIGLNEVVFQSIESLVGMISITSTEPAKLMQEINALAAVIQILSYRVKSGGDATSKLLSTLQDLVQDLKTSHPNTLFVPAITGIETIAFKQDIVPVSILLEAPDFELLPNIEFISNFSLDTHSLFLVDIIPGEAPIIVHDKIILLSRDIYNRHKKYPGALEKYIQFYLKVKKKVYAYGKFDREEEASKSLEGAKVDEQEKLSFAEPTMLRDDFIHFLDECLEERLKGVEERVFQSRPILKIESLFKQNRSPFNSFWVSDELKLELVRYLVGRDGCLLEQLLKDSLSPQDLFSEIHSKRDNDIRLLEKLITKSELVAQLERVREVLAFFKSESMSALFDYPLDERIARYLNSATQWMECFFSESILREVEIKAFDYKTTLESLDSFFQSIYASWEKSGYKEKKILIFFLVALKQSLLTLITSVNEEKLYRQRPEIKYFATRLKNVDWRTKGTYLRGERRIGISAAMDAIAEYVVDNHPELQSVILSLLDYYPLTNRATILNLLMLMVNPIGFVEASLDIGAYSSKWDERIYAQELSNPGSNLSWNIEKSRADVLSRMRQGSKFVPDILKSLLLNLQAIEKIPFMVDFMESRGAELLEKAASYPKQYELFFLDAILAKPEMYSHSMTADQCAILNNELESRFNVSTMSQDDIKKLMRILRDFNKYLDLDTGRFRFLVKVISCDIKKAPYKGGFEEIFPKNASLSPGVFELIYENQDLFKIVPLEDFVDLLTASTEEAEEYAIQRSPIRTAKKILKIFRLLSQKSAKERIDLLDSFRNDTPKSVGGGWSGHFYFKRQPYIRAIISYEDVPEKIRPYILMFFDDSRESQLKDEVHSDELDQKVSLVELSLARMLAIKSFAKQLRYPSTIPSFIEESTQGKDKIVQQREILHAVHHLPTNDPYLFVRELLQNSLDELQRTGKKGEIKIKDFFQGERFVVEIEDDIGMSPETVFGDLLIAGESNKVVGDHLGRFGIGFFSVLRGAKKVEIVTGDSSQQTVVVIIPIFDKSGLVVDFEMNYSIRPSNFKGTRIRKYMSVIDGEIEGAHLKTAVNKYAKYVNAAEYQIVLNDEEVNQVSKKLSEVEHPVLGSVSLMESSGKSVLLQGDLFVSELPQWIYSMIPKGILELLQENGVVLNLGKRVELIRTRNDLAGKNRYKSALQQVITKLAVDAILDLFSRNKLSLDILPYDFFWKSAGPQLWIDNWISEDAERLDSGTKMLDYSRYKNKENLIQLLVSRKLFAVNGDLVSMVDIARMIQVGILFDKEQLPPKLADLIEESLYREVRYESRRKRIERAGERELRRIYPEYLAQKADVFLAHEEVVMALTHPDLRERRIHYYYSADGSRAHAEWGNSGEKGWNLHDDVTAGIYASLECLKDFLHEPESVKLDTINHMLAEIFETSTHEDTHLLMGQGCRSSGWHHKHNQIFSEQQLKVMEVVLRNSNSGNILAGLFGKYQGTYPYFKRSDLLRELGFFD